MSGIGGIERLEPDLKAFGAWAAACVVALAAAAAHIFWRIGCSP